MVGEGAAVGARMRVSGAAHAYAFTPAAYVRGGWQR